MPSAARAPERLIARAAARLDTTEGGVSTLLIGLLLAALLTLAGLPPALRDDAAAADPGEPAVVVGSDPADPPVLSPGPTGGAEREVALGAPAGSPPATGSTTPTTALSAPVAACPVDSLIGELGSLLATGDVLPAAALTDLVAVAVGCSDTDPTVAAFALVSQLTAALPLDLLPEVELPVVPLPSLPKELHGLLAPLGLDPVCAAFFEAAQQVVSALAAIDRPIDTGALGALAFRILAVCPELTGQP